MGARKEVIVDVKNFNASIDFSNNIINVTHNGHELVTTIPDWKQLQKSINEKLQEHEKSNEC